MAGGADGDKPSLDEKLAVVEMLEGEDEAPTINVGDPAPDAEPAHGTPAHDAPAHDAPAPDTPAPDTPAPDTAAALDMAQVRAELGRLREQAGELTAALQRLEARLRG